MKLLREFTFANNSQFTWAGVPASEVYQALKKPFYFYDLDRLKDRVVRLRAGLSPILSIKYAVKANSHNQILQGLAGVIDGFDVTSGHELQKALIHCKSPLDISFAGPGKELVEMEQALSSGAVMTLESFRDINLAVEIAHRLNRSAKVCLRINPPFELKGSAMRMGGGAKQFGIDSELIDEAIQSCLKFRLDLIGLQVFSGSQCLHAEAIIEAQNKSLALCRQWILTHSLQLNFVNLGGGFGVPYFENEEELDINRVKENMNSLASQIKSLPIQKLVFELGRYISSDCGIYVCQVLDVKVSRGKKIIVTNGGFHHHLAAAGLLGQVVKKNFPIANITHASRYERMSPATIVGCLCTPLDCFAHGIDFPETHEGDLLAIFHSGAYGRSASPVDFLSHPHPGEVFGQKGRWHVC